MASEKLHTSLVGGYNDLTVDVIMYCDWFVLYVDVHGLLVANKMQIFAGYSERVQELSYYLSFNCISP